MAKLSIKVNDEAPVIISTNSKHGSVHTSAGIYEYDSDSFSIFSHAHEHAKAEYNHLIWHENKQLSFGDSVTITLVTDEVETTAPVRMRTRKEMPFPINAAQADDLFALINDFRDQLAEFGKIQSTEMGTEMQEAFKQKVRFYGWKLARDVESDIYRHFPEKKQQNLLVKNYTEHGVGTVADFIDTGKLCDLRQALAKFTTNTRQIAQKCEQVLEFSHSVEVNHIISLLLSDKAQLVRSILFDKNQEKNWLVPWHQDRTIAVTLDTDARKAQLPDWTGWTQKEGVTHVQPDKTVLDRMLTLRLHLDDTPEDNACLRVIHGSHTEPLNHDAVLKHADAHEETAYPVAAGDLVIMHPLIIHASHKSTKPTHRRVLHLEFSDAVLPEGVEWA